MAMSIRPVVDERDGLLTFLAAQRDGIRNACFGLTDEQASMATTKSTLNLAGLLKHVALTEQHWIVETMMQRELPPYDYGAGFRLVGDETLEGMLDFYADVAKQTEDIVNNEIDDLEYKVKVPEAPWFPKDVEFWNARWVLLHLIQETARHAGHADIIREHIDGKTMYELMDMAEAASS